jgi:prepilin-type processing-associated H-X9-DG protein
MKSKSRGAFTLAELLVVVPVAALLATMLFAVSNDAKQQLQAAACLNNMRQWGLGFMLYANDYRDYFPYDGDYNNPPGSPANSNAWFNVLAPYVGQKPLAELYYEGMTNPSKFPTVRNPNVFVCPSGTNLNPQVSISQAIFYYSMSVCWHKEADTGAGFRRNRATSPGNTILFCEEPEDNFPETSGAYDFVTRHFGGANFVFADGHAGWITYTNFCRQNIGGPTCPAPLGNIQWDNCQPGNTTGDWNPIVRYHWWAAADICTSGY